MNRKSEGTLKFSKKRTILAINLEKLLIFTIFLAFGMWQQVRGRIVVV
jgi:hypothetical protein